MYDTFAVSHVGRHFYLDASDLHGAMYMHLLDMRSGLFLLYIVAGVNWKSMSSVYPKFIDL